MPILIKLPNGESYSIDTASIRELWYSFIEGEENDKQLIGERVDTDIGVAEAVIMMANWAELAPYLTRLPDSEPDYKKMILTAEITRSNGSSQ